MEFYARQKYCMQLCNHHALCKVCITQCIHRLHAWRAVWSSAYMPAAAGCLHKATRKWHQVSILGTRLAKLMSSSLLCFRVGNYKMYIIRRSYLGVGAILGDSSNCFGFACSAVACLDEGEAQTGTGMEMRKLNRIYVWGCTTLQVEYGILKVRKKYEISQ